MRTLPLTQRLRALLTYANVMATNAVFVALGSDVKNKSLTAVPAGRGGPRARRDQEAPQASAPAPAAVTEVKEGSGLNNCPARTGEFCLSAGVGGSTNLGGEFQRVGSYKDGFGIVHLQGSLRSNLPTELFILPPSFRPTASRIFSVYNKGYNPDADDPGLPAVIIQADGSVCFSQEGRGTTHLSLDGISFRP